MSAENILRQLGAATGDATFVVGTAVPDDGAAGYAHMCIFIDTDASGTTGLYANIGTATSCDFNAVTVAS